MNNTTKKAVLYLRVSTEEQVDNFSLGTQEEICTREANYRGYTIDKIFREEGKSAKTIQDRVALIELLGYCRTNRKEINAVIVYKTDRLSRQIFDFLVIQQKLKDLDIKLISASEPIDDTPMGRFLGSFFAQIAQLDNDVRAERARNGMRARFKAGLFHNGHPPIGYISIDGIIVRDSKTFDKIKAAWDLMATGTKSLREIHQIINTWGVILSSTSVQRMFRSKFYTGVLYSPTYKEEVQGQHDPMITKEQFGKVQVILDGRNPNKPALAKRNPLNPDFPLRRFIKCGKCGLAFTGSWSKGRGGKYAYYFCRKNRTCGSLYIPVKNVHNALINLLKNIQITPAGKTIFLIFLEKGFSKRASVLEGKRSRHRQQLKKLYNLQKILVQKHLAGIYSDDIFKEQNQLIEKNIKSVQTVTNNDLIERYNLQSIIEYISKRINNLILAYEEADISQKKILLSLIFPRGFIWNYPDLIYPAINPMFKEIC